MGEKDAALFRAVVSRIAKNQFPCFVLENVEGIRRVMDEVISTLKACGYLVIHKLMDPVTLGEPLLRPRYYFIGLRRDLAAVNQKDAEQVVDELWGCS